MPASVTYIFGCLVTNTMHQSFQIVALWYLALALVNFGDLHEYFGANIMVECALHNPHKSPYVLLSFL